MRFQSSVAFMARTTTCDGRKIPLQVSKIQLHRQRSQFAFQRGDTGIQLGDNAGLRLFACQCATVELDQQKLDEVGRDGMAALRIAPSENASPDVLVELQLERCRMSTAGTSGRHGAFSMQGPASVSDHQAQWTSPWGSLQ